MGKNSHTNHKHKNDGPEPADDIDAALGVDNHETSSVTTTEQQQSSSGTSTAAMTAATDDDSDNAYGPFTGIINGLTDLRDKYQEQLAAEPFKTKIITSCAISILGEVVGGFIKNRRHHAAITQRGGRPSTLQAPAIFDPKRMALFGVYGLAITGPMFHWWYAFLDKTVRSWNLTGNSNLLAKLALDRLVMTPPFLLITLVYLNYFQSFNATQVSRTVKNIYAGALYLNWRVWTVAQAVNFRYVPLEYRVLFGNMVALWWNIVLSLRN